MTDVVSRDGDGGRRRLLLLPIPIRFETAPTASERRRGARFETRADALERRARSSNPRASSSSPDLDAGRRGARAGAREVLRRSRRNVCHACATPGDSTDRDRRARADSDNQKKQLRSSPPRHSSRHRRRSPRRRARFDRSLDREPDVSETPPRRADGTRARGEAGGRVGERTRDRRELGVRGRRSLARSSEDGRAANIV
jgi:hypothetical protein